jgi:hypothetical protein
LLFRGAGKTLKALPGAVTGVNDDAARYYMQNVDAVDNARPIQDVTDDLSSAAKNFRRGMSKDSTEAFNILSRSGRMANPEDLTAPIKAAADKFGKDAVTPQAKGLAEEFEALRSSIETATDFHAVPLDRVKNFVRQIDDMIDYEAVDFGRASSRDKALLSIRGQFDSVLKQDPEYANMMAKISGKSSAVEEAIGNLKNPKAMDNMLTRVSRGKDPRTAESLQTLDESMGTDFSKQVKDSGIKDMFTRENSRGTRNTLVSGSIGAITGSLFGVPPWISGAVAATAGPVVDKQGRAIYQSLLRAAAKSPDKLKKYTNALNNSMQSGPASLIATHQILLNKDPEYAEAMAEE